MRVLLICNTDGALYVFRRPIIDALLSQGHEVVTISGRSTYFERLERLGVCPIALDFSRHSISPIKNMALLLTLVRLLLMYRPDVVHCFTHKPAIYGALAARLAGCSSVLVTITGLGTLFIGDAFSTRILRLLLLMQYKIALFLVKVVFFQNPDDLNYFVSRRILSIKKAVLTHGSGVDLTSYPLPSRERINMARRMVANEVGLELDNRKVVLLPARAVREKGFLEFYSAAKSINAHCGDSYVFIHLGLIDTDSGSGLSMHEVQALAQHCGVRYLGFKENVDEYMCGADIVVLPSYREGTPRSLIEALALGKVIVTTDAPGCRETVVNGWNGVLCKVADVPSLISALLSVNSQFVEHARSRSRELCESKFDSSILVRLTLPRYGLAVGE